MVLLAIFSILLANFLFVVQVQLRLYFEHLLKFLLKKDHFPFSNSCQFSYLFCLKLLWN